MLRGRWQVARSGTPAPPDRAERIRTLVFLGMCLTIGLAASPLRPGVVLGESMAPTFRSGQVFLLSLLSRDATVGRDDVVLFGFNGQTYLKRVYAVAGDEVWGVAAPGEEGQLSWVLSPDRAPQARDLLRRYPGLGHLVRLRVPPGCVFVLGDAGANSYDSRRFGMLSVAAIRGRVIVPHLFSLWPPAPAGPAVAMAGESGPEQSH